MISEETRGRYLDPDSARDYRMEQEEKRRKRLEEERKAAGKRMVSWAGLILAGGGIAAMILESLIDLRIGVFVLAAVCAALGRGTK